MTRRYTELVAKYVEPDGTTGEIALDITPWRWQEDLFIKEAVRTIERNSVIADGHLGDTFYG